MVIINQKNKNYKGLILLVFIGLNISCTPVHYMLKNDIFFDLNPNLDNYYLVEYDSTTFRDSKVLLEISKIKSQNKNGRSYQYIINNLEKKSMDFYASGRYKNGKRKGVWKYYKNGKINSKDYWGRRFQQAKPYE